MKEGMSPTKGTLENLYGDDECPRINKCALYPDCCPAGQGDDYRKCVLIKKA